MEFFFDFISPYAYLAAERIDEVAARHGRTVSWRPVLLAALLNHNQQRGPAEIPDKRRYTFKNLLRVSRDSGIKLGTPPFHPFNPLLPLRVAALEPSLSREIFQACWRDGRAIDSPEALRGIVPESVLAAAEAAPAKEALKESTARALLLGVFGVPTVIVDGELFWGFDSFGHLETFLRGEDALDAEAIARWETLPKSASRI